MSEAKKPEAFISNETAETVLRFRDDRDWAKFHNPKDLAISLSIEAAELLEVFQWSAKDLVVEEKRSALKEELADVLAYAILLAARLGIDANEAIVEKMKKNALKYPLSDHYASQEKNIDFKDTLLAEISIYLADLAERPAGKWTSASNDRIYFVEYSKATTRFWGVIEKAYKAIPAEAATLPADFPRHARRQDLEPLSVKALIAFLYRTLRDERMHNGAFLSAAEDGSLATALRLLSYRLAEFESMS